jgi:hypothetical protein
MSGFMGILNESCFFPMMFHILPPRFIILSHPILSQSRASDNAPSPPAQHPVHSQATANLSCEEANEAFHAVATPELNRSNLESQRLEREIEILRKRLGQVETSSPHADTESHPQNMSLLLAVIILSILPWLNLCHPHHQITTDE